jgi:hypothetical protein
MIVFLNVAEKQYKLSLLAVVVCFVFSVLSVSFKPGYLQLNNRIV